jgi:NAD(P)-dependent dehydrogenase (short-subunit alcohol dehydrogenase family)
MTQRRSVIVTGAASGIGAAICRLMAGPETAILIHTRRNRDGAEAVAAQLRTSGSLAEVALCDLAEPGSPRTWSKRRYAGSAGSMCSSATPGSPIGPVSRS